MTALIPCSACGTEWQLSKEEEVLLLDTKAIPVDHLCVNCWPECVVTIGEVVTNATLDDLPLWYEHGNQCSGCDEQSVWLTRHGFCADCNIGVTDYREVVAAEAAGYPF